MSARDEDQLVLSHVERLVGATLGNGQRDDVLRAISENSAGVIALATRLSANSTIRSTVAVFVTAIQRGEHRNEPTSAPTTVRRYQPIAEQLTDEQIDRNRRWGSVARRMHSMRATAAVQAATTGLSGPLELEAAERCLEALAEPEPLEAS